MKIRLMLSLFSRFLRSNRQIKFAVVHVTTRCNAKCTDRCDIWASKPLDMTLDNVLLAIDVLAKNNFSVVYFTGGETGLYPYLVEAIEYAKEKGLITSLTTNGTIPRKKLLQMSGNLDALSVSVDHYNEQKWDETKHVPGISKKAKETIKLAKAFGMKVYTITFLNPSWTRDEVVKMVRYVNEKLKVPFALSYPFTSSNKGTYTVGGKLRETECYQRNLKGLVDTVLHLKLNGAEVATTSNYMREVLRAYDGMPMKYQCKAGRVIIAIDCKLDVFPCYKKSSLFNLRDCQNLNLQSVDSSLCDNNRCMINCFKEASEASRETCFRAVREELFSNPKFLRDFFH